MTAGAIIDPTARIGSNVEIGPWTIIGPEVEIGDNCVIASHVVIRSHTRIGQNNRIFQFSTIGEDPSDKKFQGETTWLEIGDNNVFREGSNLHRGTASGGGITRIGSGNLFMPYTHIAHDCVIGNHTIFANYAAASGHAVVDDWAILGGYAGIYQFVHVGAHSFIGAQATVNMDVPAYVIADGSPTSPHGINITGLERRGFSKDSIKLLRRAYKILYRNGNSFATALQELQALDPNSAELQVLIDSLTRSKKGIIR